MRRSVIYGTLAALGLISLVLLGAGLYQGTEQWTPLAHKSSHNSELPRPRPRPLKDSSTSATVQTDSDAWVFDHKAHRRAYGLSEAQCHAAFPLLYHEIDRASEHRRKIGNVSLEEVDVGWRGDGIVRAMIRNNELYIIDAHGVGDHNHRPRSMATLHSINRAVTAYSGSLPNIEFTITDHDSALINPDGNHTTWAYSRLAHQESLWLMPDFGFWGWPNVGLRSYSEFLDTLDQSEEDFLDKIPKLIWRGGLKGASQGLRQSLVAESSGHPWSDVRALNWSDPADIQEDLIAMEDHCQYMFVAQTEGNTYSARLKYLLNCHSIVLSHDLKWIEHFHHLLRTSGPDQNMVSLGKDFSALPSTMKKLGDPDNWEETRRIADNAQVVFRERYLTPAAEACYWRALIRAWASVQGFEPQLWLPDEDIGYEDTAPKGKRLSRKPRGTPFAAYAIMEQVDWAMPAKPRHMCIDAR